MNKVSFIYFDVGGVAIKDFSDSPKWEQLRDDLGLTAGQFADLDKVYKENIGDVSDGKKHVDTIITLFREQSGLPIPKDFSLQKYFIDHFEKNEGIWPVLAEAKKHFRIGLLTDMFPGMFEGIVGE